MLPEYGIDIDDLGPESAAIVRMEREVIGLGRIRKPGVVGKVAKCGCDRGEVGEQPALDVRGQRRQQLAFHHADRLVGCVQVLAAGGGKFRRQCLAAPAPAGRPAAPAEIASAITCLASNDASFVQGAILNVDGGRNATG